MSTLAAAYAPASVRMVLVLATILTGLVLGGFALLRLRTSARAPVIACAWAVLVMGTALHELAISVPVRAGFGLPLLYFLMHGGLVIAERALSRAGHPITGAIGRAWVFVWVLAPLPLLFHEPFLAGVIWPLIGMPGAAHTP